MKSTRYLRLLPVLAFFACSQGKYSNMDNSQLSTTQADADTTTFNPASLQDRKWVRTADVRCRVKSVFDAVTTLERTVNNMHGMVLESTMQNDWGRTEDVPFSADSLRRVQLYTPIATLTLRVPTAGLDSVVTTLTAMAQFIDHRTLKQTDKSLNYLANELRNQEPETNIQPGKKLDIARYQDSKKDEKIDRKIENLAIMDDVHYSTFTVQIFEPQRTDVQIIVNPDRVIRAGFGIEIMNALRNGAIMLREIALFCLTIWPIMIVIGILVFIFRKRWTRPVSLKQPATN
jgi:hypothetical protein